ncbi:sulfurtransferase TusA family protein [Haloarcula sediminis]|uniref:sulfurtransferase TusA family protein n=1 Tax=Haloarcula sediminis TaxID=3111777 RepID=UPI002D7A1BC0|nr:sulfurtransferase TusA family protein [Haloarcula sp. CK38]
MTANKTTDEPDAVVDARGATCPGPLMDLIGEIRTVETGAVVALLSDAEKSTSEVQEWAEESGNEVTDIVDEGDHDRIYVRKL